MTRDDWGVINVRAITWLEEETIEREKNIEIECHQDSYHTTGFSM